MRKPDGSKGMLLRKCTAEYKVREIIKKMRAVVGADAVRQWRKTMRRLSSNGSAFRLTSHGA
jgi:hypothetical protein